MEEINCLYIVYCTRPWKRVGQEQMPCTASTGVKTRYLIPGTYVDQTRVHADYLLCNRSRQAAKLYALIVLYDPTVSTFLVGSSTRKRLALRAFAPFFALYR